MKSCNVEFARACTPIILTAAGTLIGIFAIAKDLDATRTTAAMGLAGTALAGAAGLAQSPKESDFSGRLKEDSSQLNASVSTQ